MSDDVLYIAEVPYPNGQIKLRFAHYPTADNQWVRHGRFTAFYEDGTLASEGNYNHGVESGPWRDYHENGALAAEGDYENGKENGLWQFWKSDGTLEKRVRFRNGVEVQLQEVKSDRG
jgi:antitoxin component YwqK of YwqJK toxin-antitoxin module